MTYLNKSKWFSKNFDRPIYEYEQELFAEVIKILDKESPEQVNPDDTIITGEGPEVLILIIPHKCLDGLSLVIWYEESHVSLRWCHLGNLKYHDDIDLGIVTHYFGKYKNWLDKFSVCLRGELNRTIIVRYIYSINSNKPYRIKYYLRLYGEKRIGKSYSEFNLFHYFKSKRLEEIKTSLKSKIKISNCIEPKIGYR